MLVLSVGAFKIPIPVFAGDVSKHFVRDIWYQSGLCPTKIPDEENAPSRRLGHEIRCHGCLLGCGNTSYIAVMGFYRRKIRRRPLWNPVLSHLSGSNWQNSTVRTIMTRFIAVLYESVGAKSRMSQSAQSWYNRKEVTLVNFRPCASTVLVECSALWGSMGHVARRPR